ncbi:DUF3566 domain-containing protein [Streptomyces flavofungini]|uniref:DUF3566 domain-containing protein n=1 Tax=Streptomyces flavofungini TaxID=68200 RepID=UPI0025B23C47|nr:DUF3566 domain-containing protein [Streptomyces flavofungini]WJV47529.1 DUF3566 domain-containing protein [Streptomyces flavofungini]
MSGATGAGSAGTSGTGTEGARGSATDAPDSHESHGSQGGTVTDTRGRTGTDTDGRDAGPGAAGGRAGDGTSGGGASGKRAGDSGSGALPGERQPQQSNQPYHPPQAYQAAPAGAVRRPRTGARTTPRTRKARLRVAKADPWSVMKVSFLLSIALGICTIVAAAVLWMVMDAMGVFSTVGGTISEATGSNESNGFDLQAFLSLPRVLIFTSIIAVIDVVLATALATLGAFIYNLSAGFVGGIELTLAEDE